MIGSGVLADRDAVPDGDLLRADEDVLDEKAQHALTFGDVGGPHAGAELGQETLEVVGEFEVGVAVGELGLKRVELAAEASFAGPQVRHAGAQFVDGDQLFLVGLDHAGDAPAGCGQGDFQAGAFA
ncbi:hypothetical protein [Streptomyces sp. NPDC091215]|uniref:hypothetical protein n=1 Tax=Streptomyces sp. NPDC091215 TaxID=3155192 RepID=UPI00341BBA02